MIDVIGCYGKLLLEGKKDYQNFVLFFHLFVFRNFTIISLVLVQIPSFHCFSLFFFFFLFEHLVRDSATIFVFYFTSYLDEFRSLSLQVRWISCSPERIREIENAFHMGNWLSSDFSHTGKMLTWIHSHNMSQLQLGTYRPLTVSWSMLGKGDRPTGQEKEELNLF